MNEGASQCAGGIEGACDALYFPVHTWPSAALAAISLIVLVVLIRKNILKVKLPIALGVWFVVVALLGVSVWAFTETEAERTRQRARICQESGNPACEF